DRNVPPVPLEQAGGPASFLFGHRSGDELIADHEREETDEDADRHPQTASARMHGVAFAAVLPEYPDRQEQEERQIEKIDDVFVDDQIGDAVLQSAHLTGLQQHRHRDEVLEITEIDQVGQHDD